MKKKFLEALGNKIRCFRKSTGLSQEQLAELSNLHRNYIGGLERGEKNPTITTLLKIADGLGICLTDLLKIEKTEKNEL